MDIGRLIAQRFPRFHYLLESGTNIVAKTYHPEHLLNGAVARLSVVAVIYPFGRYAESAWIAHNIDYYIDELLETECQEEILDF